VLVRPKHTGIREFRTIPVKMFYPGSRVVWQARATHNQVALRGVCGASYRYE
jgi:hypothetical protein